MLQRQNARDNYGQRRRRRASLHLQWRGGRETSFAALFKRKALELFVRAQRMGFALRRKERSSVSVAARRRASVRPVGL
jgi:hypothetical protein